MVGTATTQQGGGPTPGSCKRRISNAPRSALRITFYSMGTQWVKRRRCDADHSNLPSDKVKNEWSYTYTPLACHRSVQRENFTFYFTLTLH